jgi:hypothetical protein
VPQGKAAAPMKAVPAPAKAEPEEAVADVALSPEWKALGQLLTGKAAKHGRVYAVMSLNAAERAQLMKAMSGEPGVKVKAEGDGHFKRVAVVPEKVAPMPRKMQFPADDDEDEDDED